MKQKSSSKNQVKKAHVTHIRHYNSYMAAGLFSFPLIAFIISPFFHELFHMLVLWYHGCRYWADFNISLFSGLYATIHHQCALERFDLAVLYLSGVAGTLCIGLILLAFDRYLTKKGYLEYSVFTSFIAIGFLFSPVIYFFSKDGDLVNALDIMYVEYPSYLLPSIGISIMILSFLYFLINLDYTSEKELLEEEELDRFGVKKTKKEEHKKYMRKPGVPV